MRRRQRHQADFPRRPPRRPLKSICSSPPTKETARPDRLRGWIGWRGRCSGQEAVAPLDSRCDARSCFVVLTAFFLFALLISRAGALPE